MPVEKLRTYLDANNVKYTLIPHNVSYTALQAAHSAHISGRRFAKPVLVKIDGALCMVVIPANEKLDLRCLQRVTHARNVELAKEEEFKSRFPDCEVGAEPPMGNLYGIPVFIARSLAADDTIAFNAGTHNELIELPYQAYERLVSPQAIPYPV